MASRQKPVAMRFPLGVDQVSAETELPPGTARRVVNLDIHNGGITRGGTPFGGRASQRSSVELLIAGVRTHSLWSCAYATLYVAAGNLMHVSADLVTTVLRAGVGEAEMFYDEINGAIFYSNGSVTGSVINGSDAPWGIPVPVAPAASAVLFGGLDAGTYMVAYTYKDASGRESGATPTAVVQVVAGGGVQLNAPTGDTGVGQGGNGHGYGHNHQNGQGGDGTAVSGTGYITRVYVSPANGEALYWAHDIPAGAAVSYVGTHQPGKIIPTQYMAPIEACTHLAYYNGRIYGAVGNALVATQPMNYDLTRPATDFVLMPAPITMNKAVVDGLYLGSQHGVTFLAGNDIGQFTQRTVDNLPPIPGSGMRVDGALFEQPGDGVVWLTQRGWVFGGAGGQTKRLTESQMALPKYDRAAGLYREHDGMRQVMTFVKGGGEAAGASDSYDVEIVRNGRIV